MAYNLKYWGEFKDIYDTCYRVEILGLNFNGVVEEIEFGPDGVILTRPSKDLTEPLFSCGVKIQVWCKVNFQFTGLFAVGETENMVIVKRLESGNSDVEVFRGFVEPNLYEEDFSYPPYTVIIPANDGLSALEDKVPSIPANCDLLKVIRTCLQQTGMDLPIAVCHSGYVEGKSLGQLESIFEQLYCDPAAYQEVSDGIIKQISTKKVLEEILKLFGCRIYQHNGVWWIDRYKNIIDGRQSKLIYDSTNITSIGQNVMTPFDTSNNPFTSHPNLTMDSGYGKIKLEIKEKRWSNVVNQEYQNILYRNDPMTQLATLFSNYSPNRWYQWRSTPQVNEQNSFFTSFVNNRGIDKGCTLVYNNTGGQISLFMYQKVKCSITPGSKIKLSFKWAIEKQTNAPEGEYRILVEAYTNSTPAVGMLCTLNSKAKIVAPATPSDRLGYQFTANEKDFNGDFYTPLEETLTIELSDDAFVSDELVFKIYGVNAKDSNGLWKVNSTLISQIWIGDVLVKIDEQIEYPNTIEAEVNKSYRRDAPSLSVIFNTLPRLSTATKGYNLNFANGFYTPTIINGIGRNLLAVSNFEQGGFNDYGNIITTSTYSIRTIKPISVVGFTHLSVSLPVDIYFNLRVFFFNNTSFISTNYARNNTPLSIPANATTIKVEIGSQAPGTTNSIIIQKIKLESGLTSTLWIPSPEDSGEDVSSIKLFDLNPASGFCDKYEDGILSAAERALIDIMDQYYFPRITVNGEVTLKKYISPDHKMEISTLNNVGFVLTSLEAYLHAATYTVKLTEIKTRHVLPQALPLLPDPEPNTNQFYI